MRTMNTLPEGGSQGLENTDKGFSTENMIKVFLTGYTHHQTQTLQPLPERFCFVEKLWLLGFLFFQTGVFIAVTKPYSATFSAKHNTSRVCVVSSSHGVSNDRAL